MSKFGRKTMLVVFVALLAVFLTDTRAEAFGWGCYYGCAPSYSVCCDPCWTPCDSWCVGYRPGPIRRLLFGPYRWYPVGYASCCATSYTSYMSCCDGDIGTTWQTPTPATEVPSEAPLQPTEATEPTTGGWSESSAGLPGPTDAGAGLSDAVEPPTDPPASSPLQETPELPPGLQGTEPSEPASEYPLLDPNAGMPQTRAVNTAENSGLLTIWVPYDAKVTVNGYETRSTGTRREFVSYGLRSGFDYKYEVRAVVVRKGQPIEDVRTITLTAGAHEAVAFGFNIDPNSALAAR